MQSIVKTSARSQEVAAIAEETSAGALSVSSATQEQVVLINDVNKLAKSLQEQVEHLTSTIRRFQLEK
jgi:methyl-accepting chemotaxis protein